MITHLLNSTLNSHRGRFDSSVSRLCSWRQETEDINHYILKCEAYENERDILESTGEEVLNREDLQYIPGDINMKVMVMATAGIRKGDRNELISAQMTYIRSTK